MIYISHTQCHTNETNSQVSGQSARDNNIYTERSYTEPNTLNEYTDRLTLIIYINPINVA